MLREPRPDPTRPDPSTYLRRYSDSRLCPSSVVVKIIFSTHLSSAREAEEKPMTDEQTCPMTGEPHLWGDWERVVEGDPWTEARKPTGDRARECRVCGRWDIEWAKP